MSVINTNVSALNAQSALTVNSRNMGVVMQQLSTGSRINSAKDDAAGLAISQNMTSQIRGLDQAVRNANDGISLLQTADGALVETSNMLQRMRELSVQSANGTLSDVQRGYLNTEFTNLSTQIGKIATETVWNGKAILAGTAGDASTSTAFTFQTGQSSTTTIAATITAMTVAALGIPTGIDTKTNAANALTLLDTALDSVNNQRATIGAVTNRLTYAADNMANISTNISASRSRIMDTDYAQATSQLAKTQIIQQAATAMLAQANQQPQSVLALLK